MWMMLALFAGFAVMFGVGIFMTGRVVSSLGMSAATSKDTVRTPNGSFRLQQENQVGPGLPVYLHSSLVLPGDGDLGEKLKQARGGIQTVIYQTPDMRDFVDDWYVKHLGPDFTRYNSAETPLPDIFQTAHLPNADIAFVAAREKMTRVVALSTISLGTKISLIRLDEPTAPPEDAKPQ
jgi:hypothetical protein